jgi:hypothetical protein
MLADKYLVKNWVKKKIEEKYIIPLIGVWDSFDQIDFKKLPKKFVLKVNHGCKMNIIVKNKDKLNISLLKRKINGWMKLNFAFMNGIELQYLNIKRKIIAEKLIENKKKKLDDYKVYCFDGKAEIIEFLSYFKKKRKIAMFDRNWNKLNYYNNFPQIRENIPKPKNLKDMIRISEILSKGFSYVRVDFYVLDDESLKFGEMTFTPASGIFNFHPPEQDLILGNLLKLPKPSSIPLKHFSFNL